MSDLLFRQFQFGTDASILARRDDPETSKDAAESINTSGLEALVYYAIREFGSYGCISDDVRKKLEWRGLSYSSVTARYRALLDKGCIQLTGDKRKGESGRHQRVMVARELEIVTNRLGQKWLKIQ